MSDRIPDAELEVLTVVQREKGATAREVLRAIRSFRPLAHSSVMTLLGRLEERGLVRGEPAERREFRFIATGTRNEAVEPLLRRLLDRVFEGDAAGLVAALFETRPPTADEVARLETLLANLSESLSPEDGP
ncbi:MAG: BlaI/MecI/CopY family transcriptional regulator [Gemmatimonadota bacterium]